MEEVRMLFLLTGEVQIGKTRWLESLVTELADRGVPCAGVLAPGQWVPSEGEHADANGFEKLGIDNVLLPSGERIPFARRGDLARADGTFDEESQAAKAELAWHIDDAAIDRVNAHFNEIATHASVAAPGLLIVDELGRLEIWRGGGLTSAMALLAQGPTTTFPHALAVVRDYLLDDAEALLAEAWPDRCRIKPNDAAREAILAAFEV
ncbi:nucleoside-triphosphatase [uncultured Adlercreutzia sp.]|uniref:nucleoside-triphosphatase n=1 Tax=uncultured Adlercreutzia sp. TaxID=875803 RepID=UPI0026671415|nr:nucleoside-triphosphatase [uncultured Adlercreutzia sp.]